MGIFAYGHPADLFEGVGGELNDIIARAGNSDHGDIGIAAGGKDAGVLFKKGKRVKSLKRDEFVDALIDSIITYK